MISILVSTLMMVAWGAIPNPATPCANPQRILSAQEAQSLTADQLKSGCFDLSALGKSELMALADKQGPLRLKSNGLILSRRDVIELQEQVPVILEIDSKQFNRNDIQLMQQAGVGVILQTFQNTFNMVDYREMARTGALTIYVNSPVFSKTQAKELMETGNVQLVIDPLSSGLSSADIRDIQTAALPAPATVVIPPRDTAPRFETTPVAPAEPVRSESADEDEKIPVISL